MAIPHLRTEVQNLIDQADDRLLRLVYALAITYGKEEVVAYTTKGQPLTKEAYLNELEEGQKDVENGRTISSQELKERVATWNGKYSK